MVRRTTWILLGLFAVLAVFAWWFQRNQSNQGQATATSAPLPTAAQLFNLDTNQVSTIRVASQTGEKVSLLREQSSMNWGIQDIPIEQVDTNRLASVISPLLTLQVSETLAQTPALGAVGLDQPAYTITILRGNVQEAVLSIGNLNAIGTGYYARLGNGPILILDNVILDDVFKLLSEPALLPTATPQVTETASGTPIAPQDQVTPTP